MMRHMTRIPCPPNEGYDPSVSGLLHGPCILASTLVGLMRLPQRINFFGEGPVAIELQLGLDLTWP
jgi:hypothetical protein